MDGVVSAGVTPQDEPADRVKPPYVADERTTLDGWLDFHRRTLLWKCEGLTDDQLRSRPVPPSTLSLIGLVRHMAEVERGWFADHFGMDDATLYCTEEAPAADFDDIDSADIAADLATLRAEIDTYREAATAFNLDHIETTADGRQFGLRWVYTHMIEEYARHNGHADMLREAIDGATGD
ncbi:MAG: DinB family protein [Nocardioidaceae bacterium]|nr:DinB family protein [Nocardioidaceae bacterium]